MSPFQISVLLALFLLPLLFLLLLRRHTTTTKTATHHEPTPPSPPKLPIIGNLHLIGPLPHRSLQALSQTHGPLLLLHLGHIPTLIVSSPESAQEITMTHDSIFASRPFLPITQHMVYETMDMVFAPYGDYWRRLKKLCVSNLFSSKMIRSFSLLRKQEVVFMIKKVSLIAESATGAVVDLNEVLDSFANDVVCRMVSRKLSGGRNSKFREVIDENEVLLGSFLVGEYVPWLGWIDLFFGLKDRARRNAKRWSELLDEVISAHRRSRSEDGEDGQDFVDVLLSLEKEEGVEQGLTGDQIKALLVDMFAAGTDTSYAVLEWAMAELVKNPEAMNKLTDEVRSLSKCKSMVEEEDLNQMIYLRAVLKEVLRLHPPVPLLIPRESVDNCQVQGYHIPKKTRVFINAWALGRDPKIWEEPENFLPERFIDSAVDFRGNDFQFIPFGAGRRICPGMNFAVTNVELALANLIHKFDWELPFGVTRENMDMAERPGLTTHRREKLHLLAKSKFEEVR